MRPLRWLARRLPGGVTAGRAIRRILDPDLRAIARVQREPLALQPYPTTTDERYPELFDALGARLAHFPAPRILSFGCATGEEVRALRARLPHARITGIDLNPRAIASARKRDRDPLSEYRVAGAPAPGATFHAILAMAVLRDSRLDSEQPTDCSAFLPFSRYAEAVARLDAALEPGGWFAIWHSQFRFTDTPVAAGYSRDPDFETHREPWTLIYGPDDKRIANACEDAMLFRKAR